MERGSVLFAVEDFIRRGLESHPDPLTCTSRLSVWVVPRNQSVEAKPLDKAGFNKENQVWTKEHKNMSQNHQFIYSIQKRKNQ